MKAIFLVLLLFSAVACGAQSQNAAIKIDGSHNNTSVRQENAATESRSIDSQNLDVDLHGDHNVSDFYQSANSDTTQKTSKKIQGSEEHKENAAKGIWEFVTNINNLAGLLVSLSVLYGLSKGWLALAKKLKRKK